MQDIKLYAIYPEYPVMVKPAESIREWMPPNAWRCLPVRIANQYGYNIHLTESFSVEWNGGPNNKDIIVRTADGKQPMTFVSNSGNGFFSISTNLIIRTPQDVNTFITGPINHPRQNISPVSAIVETDWNIAQLSMNFKILEPHVQTLFLQGEPFCTFFPIERRYEEKFQLSLEPLGSNAEELQRHLELRNGLIEAAGDRKQHYARATYINGDKCPIDHQTRLQIKPVSRHK